MMGSKNWRSTCKPLEPIATRGSMEQPPDRLWGIFAISHGVATKPGARLGQHAARTGGGLTLSGRGCGLSDEGDRLRRIGIVLESKHGCILTADHLSQHKAQVDTGVCQRLGDSVAKTGSVVALHEHGRDR